MGGLLHFATAGTDESGDVVVTVTPADQTQIILHTALRAQFGEEEQRKPVTSFGAIFASRALWLLVAVYCAVMLAVNTLAFWMPSLIHSAGVASDASVGLLSAVPYVAGCVFMLACGRSSDRQRERRWHLCVPLLMAAAGIAFAGFKDKSFF